MTPLEFSNHVGTMDGSHICQCGKRHIIGEGGFGVSPSAPPAGAPTENLANAQATQNGPPGKNILNDPQAAAFLRLSGSSSNDAFPEDRLETLAKDFEAVERFAGTSPSTWPVVLRQAIASNRAQAELVCALRTKLREHNIDP